MNEFADVARRTSAGAAAGLGLALALTCASCAPPAPRPMTSEPESGEPAAPLPAEASPSAGMAEAPTPAGALPLPAQASAELAEPATPADLANAATAGEIPQELTITSAPPMDADSLQLHGYERREARIEVSTDRNAVEFPGSLTRAHLSHKPNPAGQGAGKARSLQLDLRLPKQTTPFATCTGKNACGCNGITPYAYISLAHPLPPKTELNRWRDLSFWVRSREPFDLNVVLSCFIEPRPQRTDAPFDGYLDEAHTEMNPCWHATRVELPLRAPIAVLGDDQWHRYQVRVDDLPASPPVELSGGGQMICTLAGVTHVVYVIKRAHPGLPGDYPKDAGAIQFDDLQALRPR